MRISLGAALMGAVLSLALAQSPPARPPEARYCTPIAFRDRVTPLGYQAVIRAAPGCRKAAKVRKQNALSGSVIGEPWLIPVGVVERPWVFTHRFYYTLDDRVWRRLAVQ